MSAPASRKLSDWLAWQETLHPDEIELGLDRVRTVLARLGFTPPEGRVFTVAGTNGKGSCVAAVATVLRENGWRTGVYTSPHLVRYNERICIDGRPLSDEDIVAAFERVEAARGDVRLTYFEFGTLAAWSAFAAADCAAWVLEVGLGGRLDAVNAVDADFAIVTTVGLDHQAWLGDTVDAIAAEKAGIFRAGRPAFFGGTEPPPAVHARARELRCPFAFKGQGFDISVRREDGVWHWKGRQVSLQPAAAVPVPEILIDNQAVALAALEACDPALLETIADLPALLATARPPGRFQRHCDTHEWVFDVAHNPQAAEALRSGLEALASRPTTIVIGLLADKAVEEIVTTLGSAADRWLVVPTAGRRGTAAEDLCARMRPVLAAEPEPCDSLATALTRAREQTAMDGRIVVCGSFTVVGPALEWLGLY